MEGFWKIMEKIQEEQYQSFCQKLPANTTRKEYICIYLNTFLGNYLSMEIPDEKFDQISHKLIDSISLSGPEISFLHKMVDCNFKNNYVEELIKLYHETTNLDKCQLGKNMMKCLEASNSLHLCHDSLRECH